MVYSGCGRKDVEAARENRRRFVFSSSFSNFWFVCVCLVPAVYRFLTLLSPLLPSIKLLGLLPLSILIFKITTARFYNLQ